MRRKHPDRGEGSPPMRADTRALGSSSRPTAGMRREFGDDEGSGRIDAWSAFDRFAGLTMGRRARECRCSSRSGGRHDKLSVSATEAT
jgi:hypothetical protein